MKLVHWLILMPVLAGTAYFCAWQFRRSQFRAPAVPTEEMVMRATPEGGLLWLKTEYRLSDADYERIHTLHEGYLPGCQERCAEIARVRKELFSLIQQSKTITPVIKFKLDESARLRSRCHELMLAHFYEVAAAMPPGAASRYIEWVTRETLMD